MMRPLTYYFIMLILMLALLEGIAFIAAQLVDADDFFDDRERVFARLNEADLAEFKTRNADPQTGWHNRGHSSVEEENCQGKAVKYHFDSAGARLYQAFDEKAAQIVVVGDSYTNSAEVEDSEAYPARLAELLGASVANHGVGGYGPVQSVLNLQENIARYSEAKIVILGIMYENLYRMVNSYRPVLYATSSDYTLKPYMAAGRVVPIPGSDVFDSLENFKQAADQAFDRDFWAKPVAEFPYSAALFRGFSSNYFYYRKLQKTFRKLGKPEYFLIFEDREIKLNLLALLNQYASMARDWDVQPVVIFIPRNRFDTSSASRFIAEHRTEMDSRLLIGDVAASEGVDWVKFNLQEKDSDNICHPSPYGYQVIAQYIARFLRESGAWPVH